MRRAIMCVLAVALGACREEPAPSAPDAAPSPPDAAVPDMRAITITMGEPQIEIMLPDGGLEVVDPPPEKVAAAKKPRRPARKRPVMKADRPAAARAAPAGPTTPMQTIRSNMRDVEHCYGQVALKDPSVAGRVVLQWTLGRDGAPTATAVVQDTLSDKSVGACMRARAHRWRFPPPPGGVQVIKYPFDLRVQ